MSDMIPVKMFWDIDEMKVTVPPEATDEDLHRVDRGLVAKLNSALETYNLKFFLKEIVIYADPASFSETRAGNMTTTECTVRYSPVPARDQHCDGCGKHDEDQFARNTGVARRRLIERILIHAIVQPDAGSAMLIVASDHDFSHAIKNLVEDGYNIMTAVESGDESVAKESTVSWLWGEIQQGNRPNVVKAVRERRQRGAQ